MTALNRPCGPDDAARSAIYDLQWLAFTMLGCPCAAWARTSPWRGFFAPADQRKVSLFDLINESS